MAKRGRPKKTAVKARATRLVVPDEAPLEENTSESASTDEQVEDLPVVHHKKFGEIRVKPEDIPLQIPLPPTENIRVPVIVNGCQPLAIPVPELDITPICNVNIDTPVEGSVIVKATSDMALTSMPTQYLPPEDIGSDFLNVIKGIESLQTNIQLPTDIPMVIEPPSSNTSTDAVDAPETVTNAMHFSHVLDTDSETTPLTDSPLEHDEVDKSPSLLDTKSEESQSVDDDILAPPLPEVTIRRSTRIRSIGILKQKERTTSSSPDPEKPVKVKSRWRRSSELEMHTTPDMVAIPVPPLPPPVPESHDQLVARLAREERETAEGLSLFVPIVDNEYKMARNVCKEAKRMTCDCILGKEELDKGEMGCGDDDDCLNRMLFLECSDRCALGDRCSNKRFQKHSYSGCNIFKTEKKGFGLKATKPIKSNTFIMEYVGEVVDQDEFAKRVKSYAKNEVKHFYFMSLKGDTIIDATSRGNISRFINHSCDPNAETQKWTVNGVLRIGFFSKRVIHPNEEITFDYKFQRYGKEAQKCYCEAPSCRGWIGENPDDDESDESDAGSDEDDQEEENSVEASDDAEAKVANSENSDMDLDSDSEAKPAVEIQPRKKRGRPRKAPGEKKQGSGRRKEERVVEDLGLEEEIQRLTITGVKNRAHTLMLSRLMVRAEDWPTRLRLLQLIATGDEPCRRLFIDYHGLRFLHAWMQSTVSDATDRWLRRLEILKTLATLPIPNKTMLLDSKVLALVEEWSGCSARAAVQSPSGDSAQSDEWKPAVPAEKLEEGEVVPSLPHSDTNSPMTDAAPDVQRTDLNDDPLKREADKLMTTILKSWSNLNEVFKIPKKERIEQMKEHEREADRGYVMSSDSNLENFYSRYKIEKSERRETRERDRPPRGHESPSATDPSWFTQHHRKMSKQERRQLFALKVLREEENERKCMKQEELWSQHQARCAGLGLDPSVNAAMDPITGYPVFFDQKTRTWSQTPPYQTYPYGHQQGYSVPGYPMVHTAPPPPPMTNTLPYPMLSYNAYPTPSPMYMPKYPAPTSVITLTPEPSLPEIVVATPSDVPVEHHPPDSPAVTAVPATTPIKLPPKWKAAKDPRGVLYYYHVKTRKSQGLPPCWTEEEAEMEARRAVLVDEQESSSESDETESEEEDVEMIETDPPEPKIIKTELEEIKIEEEAGITDESDTPQPEEEETNEATPTVESSEVLDGDLKEKTTETPEEQASPCDPESTQPLSPVQVPSSTPAAKPKRRQGLVQEHLISPRYESSRAEFKKYKEAKLKRKKKKEEKLRASKGKVLAVKKKRKRDKSYVSSSGAETPADRKIKETFKSSIAGAIVSHLNPYRRPDCKSGHITTAEDFKHLARKLTHFVMLKELKHCQSVEDLQCNDSVKAKARDFVRKYMSKFGQEYERLAD